MKILEEGYERAEPEGRCKTFAWMIRTEIRIDGWMERGENSPSDEVTPADALLKVSTVNGICMIVGSWAGCWNIVNWVIIVKFVDGIDDGIAQKKWSV